MIGRPGTLISVLPSQPPPLPTKPQHTEPPMPPMITMA